MPPPKRAQAQPAEDETVPEGSALQQALEAAAAQQAPAVAAAADHLEVRPADPNELPGQRLNTTQVELEPIRKDEQGRIWYQEEVQKPAFAKPRGRRVLTYIDSGSKTVSSKDGEFTESFEVAGDQRVSAQAKITLPSYQVGIYKDPRYPFKVHVYNENRGFDLFEVQAYYGGAELVPAEVKRIYVENVLCYDMRTVIRAIQSEFRQLQLMGRV